MWDVGGLSEQAPTFGWVCGGVPGVGYGLKYSDIMPLTHSG